jgi:hypothetical protein
MKQENYGTSLSQWGHQGIGIHVKILIETKTYTITINGIKAIIYVVARESIKNYIINL